MNVADLRPGMMVFSPADPDPPADGGEPAVVWIVADFGARTVTLKSYSEGGKIDGMSLRLDEDLPEPWRLIDSDKLADLLDLLVTNRLPGQDLDFLLAPTDV